MTGWTYVDMRKDVGDKDHLKVFATFDAAEAWLEEKMKRWARRRPRSLDERSGCCSRREAGWSGVIC
jgi:hypothetical protein